MPEVQAAYQKALRMSQQEPEKRLAELSNLGDAKRLKVQDKLKPKEKYHAIHDADDPRRLSRR